MTAFLKSCSHAFHGIREVLLETNFRRELFLGFLAVLAAFPLKTSLTDKEVIILCVGLVLGAEATNTAVEQLSDFVSPAHHAEIRVVKDLMAAAVLICSIAALAIGIIIFGNALYHA